MDNNNQQIPGKGLASGGLACGIIAVVLECFAFFIPYVTAIVGLILGIVAVCLASSAKKKGFTGGIRTGATVMGVLGIIFGALMLVENLACTAACIFV